MCILICFGPCSLVFIISAVASPIIGVIVDYTGRNIFWVALGVLLTLGAHMILAFTFAPPLLAMVSCQLIT